VHQDLPPELIDDIETWADEFPKVLDDIDGLLTENRIFKQRNVDIGVVTEEDIQDWGFSGVMVRGSGLAWDLRRAQPYECYDEFDFQIPVGKNGDCYDRYLCRMEEMRQSIQIIKQACEKLRAPEGTRATCWRAARSRRPRGRHEDLDGGADPSLQALHRRASTCPRARSMPPSRRPRASSASTSWPMAPTGPTAPSCARRASCICRRWITCATGHQLADVAAIIGTMDVVFGESTGEVSRGPAGLRDHPAAVARAGAGGLADPARDRACGRHAGHGHIRALEVATFYFMFQLAPVGSVAHIQICGTTSCMICGAEDLVGSARTRSRRSRISSAPMASSRGKRSSASAPAPTRRWPRSARITTRT
jgi:hypothetical protein